MSYPFFRIISVDKNKISDEIGKDRATVKIAPLKTLRAWEARANGIYAGSGLLLGKSDHLFPSSSLYPSSYLLPKNYIQLAENVLINWDISHSGWSKGYNKNIVYTQDGPDPDSPTVATFNDIEDTGSGYWYSYGDYAPQEPDTTYIIALWVKVNEGYVNIRPYTADNSETTRKWGVYETVNYYDGWTLCTWEITTASNNDSDSLSFNWNGTWKTMSISAPIMVKKNEMQFEIDDEELQQDGIYKINIYGCDDKDGHWNPRQLRKVRYIRDHLGYGSTSNGGNHWIEIQAYDKGGNNVALGKYAENSKSEVVTALTDGSTDTGQWTADNYNMSDGVFMTVDLGQTYELDSIKVWHYYGDGRTYHKTKTAISVDGVYWEPIFDSQISGEYPETSSGHEIKL